MFETRDFHGFVSPNHDILKLVDFYCYQKTIQTALKTMLKGEGTV